MKHFPRGTKAWLICTSIGLAIHTLSTFILFPVDLIRSLQEKSQGPLMVLTFLIFARLFLYFVVPGWALYLAARSLMEWRMTPPAGAAKSPAVDNDAPTNGK